MLDYSAAEGTCIRSHDDLVRARAKIGNAITVIDNYWFNGKRRLTFQPASAIKCYIILSCRAVFLPALRVFTSNYSASSACRIPASPSLKASI